jgi:hypothetical protein
MTYDQWNVDQSDSRDEQPEGLGYGAQPEQADLAGQRQAVAGYRMQGNDGGLGEEQRQSVTRHDWAAAQVVFGEGQRQDDAGFGAQASQDPPGTEQPENQWR